MSIIPDPILAALQFVPFLVLIFGLNAILWKPMLAYLEERDHATVGARKRAEDLAARAAARLAEYEAALSRAQAEVTEFRSRRRAEAQKVYTTAVAAARAEAEARVGEAVSRIRRETEAARVGIHADAEGLARDIASQVIGRPIGAGAEAS